ncbi:outer membrane protein transport protein [Thioclava sp. FR2]|uniref:outer membrane protein transport protein n=1 Tax=Thioclava sp. FR2 TaxID=3445780 RepID=UPI003EB8E110
MKKTLAAAGLAALAASAANAGGFERSGVPLGFMFEKGGYAELSYGSVSPSVKGAAGGGLAPTGNVTPSYSQIGLAVKADLNEKLSFGVTIDPSYGADISYPAPSPGPAPYPIRGTNAELNGQTVAAVARYKFNENFSVHAGLRQVSVGGNVQIFNGGVPLYQANFSKDSDLGYLVGVAYEKPEIALRVALTYQSETKHVLKTTVFGGPVPSALYPRVELPKSVTLDFQSGVAANTLVFGSIRWVDWTSATLNAPGYPLNPLISHANDTITYNLGVGRKFNDNWSAAVSLGYEKSNGGIASNLSPTDGYASIQVGATYTHENMKISAGVRYVDIGNAVSLGGASQFRNNSATAIGLRVGFSF